MIRRAARDAGDLVVIYERRSFLKTGAWSIEPGIIQKELWSHLEPQEGVQYVLIREESP
jgi:hypothetical protein